MINVLVGGWPTPLKNMSSSVGMMTFPIYGKIIQLFQTTNQLANLVKQTNLANCLATRSCSYFGFDFGNKRWYVYCVHLRRLTNRNIWVWVKWSSTIFDPQKLPLCGFASEKLPKFKGWSMLVMFTVAKKKHIQAETKHITCLKELVE